MKDSVADTKSGWQHVGLILAGAFAGGLAWGIRGQYGHETGAMMAGLLVSSVIAIGYLKGMPALWVARAMALATIGMGIGGCETYGQTLGLTHDPRMVGNWDALRWGLIGASIKGAVWIGFSGLFLGMALGGKLLSPTRMVLFVIGLLCLHYMGIYVFNQPYDPAKKLLPEIYFSADWHWSPGEEVSKLKPRREVWGGLLLSLVMSAFWLRVRLGDRLAWRMTAWGMLGGALGFPGGQAFQAYHAWNREAFKAGVWQWLDPLMNWWNVMETSFGFIMGGVLTLAIVLNRHLISPPDKAQLADDPQYQRLRFGSLPSDWLESVLLIVHCLLLVSAEFGRGGWYGDGIILAALPLVAVTLGRYWPYWLLLPVTVIPIAGKTYRNVVLEHERLSPLIGSLVFIIVPIMVMWLAALAFSRPNKQSRASIRFTPWLLLICTWMYFGLNFAFFEYPFPWNTWTARTPNALYYFTAAVYLTGLSIVSRPWQRSDFRAEAAEA